MYTGMCNIGYRPTFYENGEKIIEVHIITEKNLFIYGKKISLHFRDFIRSEKKYSNSDELITQLNKDRYYCMQN